MPEPVRGSLLPDRLERAPAREVGRVFGQSFSDALAAAPVGRWHGPVSSGYGVHLIFVEERVPGRIPSLAEVRGAVEQNLLSEQREAANEALYRSLRARYTIRFEGVTEPAVAIGADTGDTGRP